METQYARTGNETYLKHDPILGQAVSDQLSPWVWSPASRSSSNSVPTGRATPPTWVTSSARLLAIEATAAFFLESTLIGVWVFGWKKLSKQSARDAVMWLVAGARKPIRHMDPHRQRLDATSGGVCHPQRPRIAWHRSQNRGTDALQRSFTRVALGAGRTPSTPTKREEKISESML